MRVRNSSRAIILNSKREIFLFKYYYGILREEKTVWITPGGKVEEGESFDEALEREVFEEVGLKLEGGQRQICTRKELFVLKLGEHVMAHEKYFLVHADSWDLSFDRWTDNEKKFTKDWKWWSLSEIKESSEEFFSKEIVDVLNDVFEGKCVDKVREIV